MDKDGTLNSKEQRLLRAFSDRQPKTIGDLKKLFMREAKERMTELYKKGSYTEVDVDQQAQSYVRNHLRGLLKSGWIDSKLTDKKLERGTYRLTKNGLDRLRRLKKKASGEHKPVEKPTEQKAAA